MPNVGLTAIATVGDNRWTVVGEPLYLQGAGVLTVSSINVDGIHVTLLNPAGYPANVAGGTFIAPANRLAPTGFIGPNGTNGSNGTGVTVAVKGDLQTYAGAAANLAVGTDGQILKADSTAATGQRWDTIIPNSTGVANDNLIAIANSPLGTEKPVPIQFLPTAKLLDTGAFQTVGGNARGVDAVDMQPARVNVAQVASGNNSTIGGGRNSVSSGQGATVAGGEGNSATGLDSAVGGGANNVASGLYATIAGGNTNTATNNIAIVGGGLFNNATGQQSIIGGGAANQATATNSMVLGGSNNIASAQNSCAFGSGCVASGNYSLAFGFTASATHWGQVAHSNQNFGSPGDCQASELIWNFTTTDATANVEMFLDGNGSSKRATVASNFTWAFSILVSARKSDGTSACWKVEGGIRNNAGSTVLVAAVTTTVIADGTGGTWGVAGGVLVDADDPNDSLRIRVTGAAASTIRWTAHGRIVETGY